MAKEGLTINEGEKAKKFKEEQETKFEPLVSWLGDKLKDDISKAVVSSRLDEVSKHLYFAFIHVYVAAPFIRFTTFILVLFFDDNFCDILILLSL